MKNFWLVVLVVSLFSSFALAEEGFEEYHIWTFTSPVKGSKATVILEKFHPTKQSELDSFNYFPTGKKGRKDFGTILTSNCYHLTYSGSFYWEPTGRYIAFSWIDDDHYQDINNPHLGVTTFEVFDTQKKKKIKIDEGTISWFEKHSKMINVEKPNYYEIKGSKVTYFKMDNLKSGDSDCEHTWVVQKITADFSNPKSIKYQKGDWQRLESVDLNCTGP
jgi:hypothetical protein